MSLFTKSCNASEKNYIAFTLAEVLITLGVIGVVAAITLPALTGHYQKKVLQEQFKTAYSLLQQAYLKVEADLGYTPNCYYWDINPYGSAKCVSYNSNGDCTKYLLVNGDPLPSNYNGNQQECRMFYEHLTNNIQTINICQNNSYSKGCIPEYEGIDSVIKSQNKDISDYDVTKRTSGCGGFRKNNILTRNTAFVFKNGMIMMPYSISSCPVFLVDVNGKKGPNKWGYDLFVFSAKANLKKPIIVTPGGCSVVEKGGLSTKQMIENMYNNRYTK